MLSPLILLFITEPKSATYEIENVILGIEQLTVTTLRNAVGGLDLEEALTSRDSINTQLRVVLDDATGKWGVRVNRVEIKAIEPPPAVQESMEKQMKAEREKRATILTSEGEKQSQVLSAQGAAQSQLIRAEAEAKATIIEADAQATAIKTVFDALNSSNINENVLAYTYLQQIPQIANGTASKIWLMPVELSKSIEEISKAFTKKN